MKTIALLALALVGCGVATPPPASNGGVQQKTVSVTTGSDGMTVEQRNIAHRLTTDNEPGSIKHLYLISAYSGQVLIYSTVLGKVTSSGKRLTPLSVIGPHGDYSGGITAAIAGDSYQTTEVMQDDGTYGSSVDYIYWWDSKGVYHQQYITGGMILHVSDQPLAVHGIVINMELSKAAEGAPSVAR